jgi:hypothetical protein
VCEQGARAGAYPVNSEIALKLKILGSKPRRFAVTADVVK